MKKQLLILAIITGIIVFAVTCTSTDKDQSDAASDTQAVMEPEAGFETPYSVDPDPNSIPVSPEQSLKSFRLPKGYHLEVVASEPMISEPAAVAWDGNGRMYVAQLETYMQTIDAKGQDEPVSRIMLLEDTDNDGKMDKSSVFIDKLLSPRMILCVGRELLVNETNTFDIHAYKDTDGDGKADQKRVVFKTDKKAYGNVEHQRTGLDWNLDNWIYVTTDPVRFRYKGGELKVDTLVYGNNGQFGITHDDHGRMYYSRAASGTAAAGFNINPTYGQLEYVDRYKDSIFRLVWPILKTPDANARLRADSTLIEMTAVCGQSVFRGDRLPANIRGDYFATEPVGRIVRRAKIVHNKGEITLHNVYEHEEFISSNDMNFRPVNTYSGPDGCLYIVDMYRGIIQEATWVNPGTLIYSTIKNKNLDKNIKNGRIYRLVHDGFQRGPRPQMLDASADTLLTYLDHPNGWWRDNAQKELIVRNETSVIPALKKIVAGEKSVLAKKPSALARLHALWTLEGLEAADQEILLTALEDKNEQVRKAAIRISEPLMAKGDKKIIETIKSLKDDESAEVRGQLILSTHSIASDDVQTVINDIFTKDRDHPVISRIKPMLVKNEETKKYGAKLIDLKESDRKLVIKGAGIFNTLCVACHGPEGQGLPSAVAPPLIGKFKLMDAKEDVIQILLHGLTGPVDGKTYPDQMVAMGANDDEWIASVLNYVRYDLCMRSFPNMPAFYLDWVIIQPEEVKAVREQYAGRTKPWTWDEINRISKNRQDNKKPPPPPVKK